MLLGLCTGCRPTVTGLGFRAGTFGARLPCPLPGSKSSIILKQRSSLRQCNVRTEEKPPHETSSSHTWSAFILFYFLLQGHRSRLCLLETSKACREVLIQRPGWSFTANDRVFISHQLHPEGRL